METIPLVKKNKVSWNKSKQGNERLLQAKPLRPWRNQLKKRLEDKTTSMLIYFGTNIKMAILPKRRFKLFAIPNKI